MTQRCCSQKVTVGIDLGDKYSVVCEVDARGEVVARYQMRTTQVDLARHFGGRERCRVVIEAGTHSPWVSRELEAMNHEVVVANPARIYVAGRRKNDPKDAEFLARQGRADPKLLHPLRHRSVDAQENLAVIHARDQVVRARTKLINHVRGAVKSQGGRIGKCSADAFPRRARPQLPVASGMALHPLLSLIENLTTTIRTFDQQIEEVARTTYPEAEQLQQVTGVGALTALAFVLLVDDQDRFETSRDVGPYFGLIPKLKNTGESDPQLRISKSGDELGRRLLVSAARYILGPFGPECDLRRHGMKIALRGGKNAKKRAAVAVARKLAVLLHQLWVSHAAYDPDWNLKRQRAG